MLGNKIDLLDHNGLLVETIRQWVMIILCAMLLLLFVVSTIRLYRTHRKFTFDCIVMSLEACKVLSLLFILCLLFLQVVLFFAYEFLIIHLALLLLILMIQTSIRAFICSNFFAKGLVQSQKEKWVMPFRVVYFIIVGGVLISTLIFAVLPGRYINCSHSIFSKSYRMRLNNMLIGYHWFIIDSLDFI